MPALPWTSGSARHRFYPCVGTPMKKLGESSWHAGVPNNLPVSTLGRLPNLEIAPAIYPTQQNVIASNPSVSEENIRDRLYLAPHFRFTQKLSYNLLHTVV